MDYCGYAWKGKDVRRGFGPRDIYDGEEGGCVPLTASSNAPSTVMSGTENSSTRSA